MEWGKTQDHQDLQESFFFPFTAHQVNQPVGTAFNSHSIQSWEYDNN